MIDFDYSTNYSQTPPPLEPTTKGKIHQLWAKVRRTFMPVGKFINQWIEKLQRFDQEPKLVRIADMNINLSFIWKVVSFPFRLLWWPVQRAFFPKAKSRRGLKSGQDSELVRAQRIRLLAMMGFFSVILGIIAFFALFAWYSRNLPKPGEVVRREGFSTKIVDRNGNVLYDLFESERRIPVDFDEMPEALKQATIAIEDKDFYKHSGIDMLTPFRIVYNIIFRGRVVGGSTLTQQLVKNVLLTSDRTIARKFKEFVLSLQIERLFAKDEILAMYLNEAPYGGTAWGVGAAAQMYFGKEVQELTTLESAILAGLPQRPTAYSPFLGKTDTDGEPLWQVRTKGVLRRMHEDGYISDLAYEQSLGDLTTVEFKGSNLSIAAPHFVFYVQDQLEEMYGESFLESGGLTITTTLDAELQLEAQTIVEEEIEKIEDLNITNGSVVVMHPETGEILSMVGSRDYFSEDIDGQFNVAVDGLRQPGSSIKPVTYLMMLRNGYTPGTMIIDTPTSFTPNEEADAYEPNNYDGEFRGPVSLRSSLGSSLNVPAVKSLATVGVPNFLDQAYDMGFPTLENTKENQRRFGLAVTLGGAEVHLMDTTTAYSSFANGGYRVDPVSILKVEDYNGRVLFEHKHVQQRSVMSPEESFLINNILSDNSARLLAFGPNSLLNTGRPIAVKTGTTNDQRDNWTVGWSSELMVGVWVGNNDNSAMKRVASGITGASPIWRRVMFAALDLGYKAPEWQVPSGVEQVQVDSISGYPGHDVFPERTEYVIKGTLPNGPDPIHTKLKLCKGEDKLATQARIAAGDYEEKEFIILKEDDPISQDGRNRWQEGIDSWIAGQDDSRYKVPTEYCGEETDVYVDLKKPKNETNYDQEDISIEVDSDSGDGIEKIEIMVNGSVKETVTDRKYKGTIHLSKGRYEVYARVTTRGGKQKDSNKVKIGTGGESWDVPEPSPIPSPSPSPSPSASPLVVLP